MSDPFVPPPRRPAPEPLRQEIARRLNRASAPRRRIRIVLIPLVAAVMIATVLFGVAVLGNRGTLQPVQTASPYPTTASPTPPSRTATPTPSPSVTNSGLDLDVRPMTKAEIEAQTKSCRRRIPHDDTPRRGAVRVRYAMVQIQAGVSGTVGGSASTLVVQDDVGTWICENGDFSGWTRGSQLTLGGRPGTQMASADTAGLNCQESPQVLGNVLFGVGEEVVLGRTRINVGGTKGPWQSSRPNRGMVNFRLVLQGDTARAKSVSMEVEFLNRRGDRVTIQRNDKAGGPDTGKTAKVHLYTCADFHLPPRPKPVTRPASDKAGVATCLKLVKEYATMSETPFSTKWKPRLVVSTPEQWGAVLSDGDNLVGCSLFPTKEISPMSADTGTVAKPSFYFAVNPIGEKGQSLWAAGRVPADVSGISYRLPGGQNVAAAINRGGYWMLMYQSSTALSAEENTADWEPVEVTLTRSRATKKYTIPFTERTMCRQVSHGC